MSGTWIDGAKALIMLAMSDNRPRETPQDSKPAPAAPPPAPQPAEKPPAAKAPAGKNTVEEIGGPKGPEPTRYGDWEVNGRVSDF